MEKTLNEIKEPNWAKDYLNNLEQLVMIKGFNEGIFKKKAKEIVPLRRKKLNLTNFADFIGNEFLCDSVLTFNFYGLFKISSGTNKVIQENKIIFPKIRTIKSTVIHFNSIKIEHIKKLAPELLSNFPDFKQFLVDLREF